MKLGFPRNFAIAPISRCLGELALANRHRINAYRARHNPRSPGSPDSIFDEPYWRSFSPSQNQAQRRAYSDGAYTIQGVTNLWVAMTEIMQ